MDWYTFLIAFISLTNISSIICGAVWLFILYRDDKPLTKGLITVAFGILLGTLNMGLAT